MSLTLIVPPAEEPVATEDLKAHLRLDADAEDALVAGLGLAARQALEARFGLALVEQTWRLDVPGTPPTIPLPLAPVLEVESLAVRRGGVATGLDPADWRLEDGRIHLCAAPTGDGLTAVFRAGWPVGETPPALSLAVRILAAHFHEHRGGDPAGRFDAGPNSVTALAAPWRRLAL